VSFEGPFVLRQLLTRYQQKHFVRYAISPYRSRRRPSSYFSYVVMPFTLAMWTVVTSFLLPLTR
jgi:hypothetical protein